MCTEPFSLRRVRTDYSFNVPNHFHLHLHGMRGCGALLITHESCKRNLHFGVILSLVSLLMSTLSTTIFYKI
jgi:hypothetical protein